MYKNKYATDNEIKHINFLKCTKKKKTKLKEVTRSKVKGKI